MNAPDLLDYTLGRLEPAEADAIARGIEADPTLADRRDRLRLALDGLLDDGDEYEPPRGLAGRTITFVEDSVRRRDEVLEFVPRRPRFRREDLAIAATIFFASLLALTPAILRSRERWARTACANNLQRVGLRLNQYAATHHAYPFVDIGDEVPRVGSIVCKLNESGFPIEAKDLHCPCSGGARSKDAQVPELSAVAAAMKRSHEEGCRMLRTDFAFHVGYNRTPGGDPGPLPAFPDHTIPILADQPGHDASGAILDGNSPNHGGRGQNVLFADGHVSWHDDRRVSPVDDDLFLNNENRPAYGTGPTDAVLMPSVFKVRSR